MREILYRAKAINRNIGYHRTNYKEGDFVYGLVTRLYDERFENLPATMTDTNDISGIEIDYKTIGQYTGLTDKNGVEIFEGDIVKIREFFCAVKYDPDNASYMLFNKDGVKIEGFNTYTIRLSSVIGNIHDNPELLEGEQ